MSLAKQIWSKKTRSSFWSSGKNADVIMFYPKLFTRSFNRENRRKLWENTKKIDTKSSVFSDVHTFRLFSILSFFILFIFIFNIDRMCAVSLLPFADFHIVCLCDVCIFHSMIKFRVVCDGVQSYLYRRFFDDVCDELMYPRLTKCAHVFLLMIILLVVFLFVWCYSAIRLLQICHSYGERERQFYSLFLRWTMAFNDGDDYCVPYA